jgi:hypothetical protein
VLILTSQSGIFERNLLELRSKTASEVKLRDDGDGI